LILIAVNIVDTIIKLPETPSVVARDTLVVVVFADGSETIWGKEESAEEAERLSKELEIELRAVNYVKWHVRTFIQDMKSLLKSLDIDENLLDSILIDGHSMARQEINKVTVDSIIMTAERGLRNTVLDKIYSNNFIV
jgi:hypothetical protein